MDANNSSPQGKSVGNRFLTGLKRLLIFLFRALIILFVITAIGTALYFGAPVLIDEYLLKDVDVNRSKIQEVDDELAASSEFFSLRLADFQSRLETLEIQRDTEAQTINNLQVQLSTAEFKIIENDTSIAGLSSLEISLDEYKTTLSTFGDQITAIEGQLDQIQTGISELSLSVDGQQGEIETLNDQIEARDTLGTLRQELELLKVMELVTRVRVSVTQENYGSAKSDLQSAQEIISNLISEVTTDEAAYLSDIAQRINLAYENIALTPDLVNEDLEVAWQLLLQGFPIDEPSEEITTLTPQPTGTPTPTSEQ